MVGAQRAQTIPRPYGWEMREPGPAATQVAMRGGAPLTIISGYAEDGDHEMLLAQVSALTRGGKLPFLLAADFNQDPATVAKSQLLQTLGARVVATGTPTCKQADHKPSEIDFVVASDSVCEAILSRSVV